jgi:hypothetical protein
MAHEFVIYQNVPLIIQDEQGKKSYGDVPVIRFNQITKKFEEVINTRGKGYAGRHRMKYRKKPL